MAEVKVFRVSGEIRKPQLIEPMRFSVEVPAINVRQALEKVYSDMGSRHRAKRFQIRILRVEEVRPEEVRNPVVRFLRGLDVKP